MRVCVFSGTGCGISISSGCVVLERSFWRPIRDREGAKGVKSLYTLLKWRYVTGAVDVVDSSARPPLK